MSFIKYTIQISLFLYMTPTAAIEKAYSSEQAEIQELCVKNAKSEVGDAATRKSVCECSVKKSLEALTSENYQNKDPKLRIEWLKKMYNMKLTQKEIDEDPYDIFEINVAIVNECINSTQIRKQQ